MSHRTSQTENPLRAEYWLGRVDPRPLGLFRILFGSVVLVDLLIRIPQVRAFDSDEGFAPRASVSWLHSSWSLYRWVGTPDAVMAVYLAVMLSVAALVAGYRTRLAQVATFVFLASLHARNPLVAMGPDRLIGVLAFWLLFADSGAALSLDRLLGRRQPELVPALGLRVLQWQVGVLLLFSSLAKWSVWGDGLAIYRIVQARESATPLATALLAWPALCVLLNWLVPVLELALPLALIPLAALFPRSARAMGILGGMGLFAGILAVLRVGVFPETVMASLVLFILPEWLDQWGWRFEPRAAAGASSRVPAWVAPSLAAVQFALVIWFLLTLHCGLPRSRLVEWELRQLDLQQGWMMFARTRTPPNRWWTSQATLANVGHRAFFEEAVPELTAFPPPEAHWVKARQRLAGHQGLRRAMVHFACRELNRRASEQGGR